MNASDDNFHFVAHYTGLLGQGNWILVETSRRVEDITPAKPQQTIPERITVMKSNGRLLTNSNTGAPVEIPYCVLRELLAQNLITFSEKESDERHIYRPV